MPTKIIEVVRRKEYLLMEEELIRNQEQMKLLEEKSRGEIKGGCPEGTPA